MQGVHFTKNDDSIKTMLIKIYSQQEGITKGLSITDRSTQDETIKATRPILSWNPDPI